MSNIRYLESMVDHFWPEMQRRWPAIEKPVIVPARTLRGMAPTYMRRYIDQDENSFYMFLKANPLSGDASRDMAKEFFDDFFYEKMRMPSSYDRESGMSPTRENPEFGTMEREDAISREVLPAEDDRNYQDFYEEQMAKADAQDAEKRKQERIEKLGFDPDDGLTIDVDAIGEEPTVKPAGAVQTQDKYEVGLPKQIFYAVDFHISAGGNQLGYNSGRLTGRGNRRMIRDSESETTTEDLKKKFSSIVNNQQNKKDIMIMIEIDGHANRFKVEQHGGIVYFYTRGTDLKEYYMLNDFVAAIKGSRHPINWKDVTDIVLDTPTRPVKLSDVYKEQPVSKFVDPTQFASIVFSFNTSNTNDLDGFFAEDENAKTETKTKKADVPEEDGLTTEEVKFNESITRKFRNYFN